MATVNRVVMGWYDVFVIWRNECGEFIVSGCSIMLLLTEGRFFDLEALLLLKRDTLMIFFALDEVSV